MEPNGRIRKMVELQSVNSLENFIIKNWNIDIEHITTFHIKGFPIIIVTYFESKQNLPYSTTGMPPKQ